MARQQRILVWISSRFAHERAIQQGILRFARHRADWELIRGLDPARDVIASVLRRADGVIAFVDKPRLRDILARSRLPVVNVASSLPGYQGPQVINDDRVVGRLAAEHFLERGYRSFAFIGVRSKPFSADREAGFAHRLAGAGLVYERFLRPSTLTASRPRWFEPEKPLRQWIGRLPQQTAIFAVADAVSVIAAHCCRRIDRATPDDLAILGVNNDELLCESVAPPLSSVQTALDQVGYKAAATLADMLAGQAAPKAPIRIPPLGVVTRLSTDVLAVDDPIVAAAMRFIRDHVEQPTTVEDVLDHVPVSRKSLERKFARCLGRTPLEEIRHVHIRRVESLLVHTDYSMAQIARRSGFVRPEHMATVFRKVTATTPTAYRRQFRVG